MVANNGLPSGRGSRRFTPEEIEDIKTSTLSLNELGKKYGGGMTTIYCIQHPEKYNNRKRYPPNKRRKRKGDYYMRQIHELIANGKGVWDIEDMIEEKLYTLKKNINTITGQRNALHNLKKALHRYLNPIAPVISDIPGVERPEVIIHMAAKELIKHMTECGLTAYGLAKAMNYKYPHQVIVHFRRGIMAIPLDVADFIKKYPRKSHLYEV